MIKELIQLWIKKKEIPFYYFKHLYKKDITNIFDYIGTKEANLIHFHPKLNKEEHIMIMNSKLNFALYADLYNLKTPKFVGYNFQNNFYHSGKHQNIESIEKLQDYVNTLMQINELDNIFVKPIMNFGGAGCFKITKDNLFPKLSEHFQNLLDGDYIFMEVIKQHPKINEIQASSVNSIRIVTFIKDDKSVEIVSSLMRFGIGNSEVDNTTSGGMLIGINHETGELNGFGYRTSMYGGGVKLTHHPTSNFKFEGFKIPFYKEACAMAIEALKYIPERWVGWDMAITLDGPIIIEVNDYPSIYMSGMANGGLLKNRTVADLLTRIKKGQF